ncbi:unnamed protein product, partial [Aphanomyces euteiches]
IDRKWQRVPSGERNYSKWMKFDALVIHPDRISHLTGILRDHFPDELSDVLNVCARTMARLVRQKEDYKTTVAFFEFMDTFDELKEKSAAYSRSLSVWKIKCAKIQEKAVEEQEEIRQQKISEYQGLIAKYERVGPCNTFEKFADTKRKIYASSN